MSDGSADDAAAVLDFWFGAIGSEDHGTTRKAWFAKSPAFDRAIADRFGPLIERALRGELDAWQDDARSALARILLLDQFTRNVFRGDKRAFAGDAQALAGATAMVGCRADDAPTLHACVRLHALRTCRGHGDAGRIGPALQAAGRFGGEIR